MLEILISSGTCVKGETDDRKLHCCKLQRWEERMDQPLSPSFIYSKPRHRCWHAMGGQKVMQAVVHMMKHPAGVIHSKIVDKEDQRDLLVGNPEMKTSWSKASEKKIGQLLTSSLHSIMCKCTGEVQHCISLCDITIPQSTLKGRMTSRGTMPLKKLK